MRINCIALDFPGGPVMKNLPARAGDVGLTPGPGRPRVPWGSWARVPQPLEASGGEAVLCSGDPAQPKIEQKWVSECAEFTLKWGMSHRLRWDLLSQRKMKWSYVENFLKMGLCWKSWYSKRYFFCEEPYEEKEGLLKDWRHYFCERRILGFMGVSCPAHGRWRISTDGFLASLSPQPAGLLISLSFWKGQVL